MKRAIALGVLSILAVTTTLAQDTSAPAQPGQNRRASRNDPHIVPPRATPNLQPPNAPALPYHSWRSTPISVRSGKFSSRC